MVGTQYSIGIGNGTQTYGYILQNQSGTGPAFKESSNITDKQALVQYSSPNLIDRDIAFFPRVTQGDFSGGGLQTVLIEPTQYYDSDLEIRTPGYLTLRPGWARNQIATGLSSPVPQSIAWKNDVYTVLGTSSVYGSTGNTLSPGITAKFIATDAYSLYVADGTNTVAFTLDGSTWSTLSSSTGALQQMWPVLQGTNGRFLYFTTILNQNAPDVAHALSKIDLNASLPASPIAVPTGNMRVAILDICEYQNGIAVLTSDGQVFGGCEVWYHDGQNMTRIVRLDEYQAGGICNCLGNLYVTAESIGQFEGPVLLKIQSGSFDIVARWASPLATRTSAAVGAPVASGQYVYYPLANPQINNVTTTAYVAVMDTISNASGHLGSLDALDAPLTQGPRQLACLGRAVTFPMLNGTTAYLQFQTNQSTIAGGNLYQTSGRMVASKYDFQTPGISKRFRNIEAVHNNPLAAGETVTVQMFVDQDPVKYSTLAVPTATNTNSTVGSSVTRVTAGADTVGRTLYPVIILSGSGNSSPSVNRLVVEVGGSWSWELYLDCTSRRRLLQQQTEDMQGVTGKDLYYLLRNAYENGINLTLYLAEGVSYLVAIETLEATTPAYSDHLQSAVRADEEWLVHIVLKQTAL